MLCGATFDSYRKMYSHQRSCREQMGEEITIKHRRKIMLKPKKQSYRQPRNNRASHNTDNNTNSNTNITIVDQSTVNVALQVNVNHYHVHMGKVGKLAVEDSIHEIGGPYSLSHLCKCSRCNHIITASPLTTPITRIHHSADRFMDQLMEHISLLDDMPVMKGSDKHTLYGGKIALSNKIREIVNKTEKSKNVQILRELGIKEERDIYKRVRQLENSLVMLAQQIESYQKMGDACADAFLKRTPDGVSTRTLVTDKDLITFNKSLITHL